MARVVFEVNVTIANSDIDSINLSWKEARKVLGNPAIAMIRDCGIQIEDFDVDIRVEED